MQRLEVKFAPDDVDGQTGEFSGYGAVFGNVDSHGDVITPGAFAKTLGEWERRGSLPSMRLMHGTMANPFSGDDTPIGVWKSMREDAKGLFVEGKLSGLDTDRGRYTYGLVKDGALSGLSIGYRPTKTKKGRVDDPHKRLLEEIALFEISFVDVPSNASARVTALKAAQDITTIREFETFLRDVGGFSNAKATAIASQGYKASEPRDEDGTDLAAILRRNIETLSN